MSEPAPDRLVAVLDRLVAALESSSVPTTGAPPLRPLLVDAAALAELLGISVRHVRRLDERGQIPQPLALGGVRRWALAEIEAWIAAGAPSRRDWAERRSAL